MKHVWGHARAGQLAFNASTQRCNSNRIRFVATYTAANAVILLLFCQPPVIPTKVPAVTFDMKDRSARSDPSTPRARRRGVIMWAHGRSGTTTYSEALKYSAHFEYCNGIKEGFSNMPGGKILNMENLKNCVARNKMLTHIKPQHLTIAKPTPGSTSHIDTPETLMKAARNVGYEVIVVEYRANALARMVSSWELHARKKRFSQKSKEQQDADTRWNFCPHKQHGLAHFKWHATYLPAAPATLIEGFEADYAIWERGVAAAYKEGLTVIMLGFQNVTQHLCESVNRTTRALEPSICGGSKCACKMLGSSHTKGSKSWHRAQLNLSLADRTSKEAARCITGELKGNPNYAWMLNLSQTEKGDAPSTSAASSSSKQIGHVF